MAEQANDDIPVREEVEESPVENVMAAEVEANAEANVEVGAETAVEARRDEEEEVEGEVESETEPVEQQSVETFISMEEGVLEEMESSEAETTSESSETKRKFITYLELVKNIDELNQAIENLKNQIARLCMKPCKTKCDYKDIQRLRNCLENENLKLRCLIQKAMLMQSEIPKKRFDEIQLATTLDEDNVAAYSGGPPVCREPSESSSAVDCEEEMIKKLCEILQGRPPCEGDREILQELMDALLKKKKPQSKSQCPCPKQKKKKAEAAQKQSKDVKKKDDQKSSRETKIELFQQRIDDLQEELCLRKKDLKTLLDRCSANQEKKQKNAILEKNIDVMQCEIGKLQKQMRCLLKEAQRSHKSFQEVRQEESDTFGPESTKDENEYCKMKKMFKRLMDECCKKDAEIDKLKVNEMDFCNGIAEKENVEETELQILRRQLCELKEEQEKFKCIVKEQAEQIEDYRRKFLNAQQKAEQQASCIEKLNRGNQRIEQQINMEIKEIKNKFQEKLNELAIYPRLIENEKAKLSTVSKEKKGIEDKLYIVCKELKCCKNKLEAAIDKPDCRRELCKCKQELILAKNRNEELSKQQQLLCDQMQATKDDLDMLRSEASKIISRTKERADFLKQTAREKMDRLERELALCRASTCKSINEREAIIKDMQGQINNLSYSFDSAQKLIKTLRNHISYISEQNCIPDTKC